MNGRSGVEGGLALPFTIVRNDITKIKADIIVNSANPKPVIGGGTDSAVYEAAGADELLEKRKEIGDIQPGDAFYTDAFALDAKYIIHAVAPPWIDGEHDERNILHSCYKKALNLVDTLGAKSIAFPLLATGVYGFPKDEALSIAMEEIHTYLLSHEDVKITLVVFDKESFVLSKGRFGGLEAYIDEHYVGEQIYKEYSVRRRRASAVEPDGTSIARYRYIKPKEKYQKPAESLDDLLDVEDMTFQQKLLYFIDKEGLKDSEFYKCAGITKQVFSKIRSNEYYQPKKETVIGAVLALRLDIEEAEDLLERAGYAFSPTSKFDVIITYCIRHGIYNIMEVNEALFKYNQKILKI